MQLYELWLALGWIYKKKLSRENDGMCNIVEQNALDLLNDIWG